jgi:hypothetical protein
MVVDWEGYSRQRIDVCKTQLNSATSAADMTEIGDFQVVEDRYPSEFSSMLLPFEGSDSPASHRKSPWRMYLLYMFDLHCGAMVWYGITQILPRITYIIHTVCIYGDGVARFILS